MSIAQAVPTMDRSSSRWLLLGSLALNLFFLGVAIAMAVRAPAPSYWDRNVFVRVERLAARCHRPTPISFAAGSMPTARQSRTPKPPIMRRKTKFMRSCGRSPSIARRCEPRWRRPGQAGRPSTRLFRVFLQESLPVFRRQAGRPWPIGHRDARPQGSNSSNLGPHPNRYLAWF